MLVIYGSYPNFNFLVKQSCKEKLQEKAFADIICDTLLKPNCRNDSVLFKIWRFVTNACHIWNLS